MFGLKLLFLIAVIGGVIYWLITLFKSSDKERKALLLRCRNDQAQADRLIAHEMQRDPKLDRNAAAKAALESLRRDSG